MHLWVSMDSRDGGGWRESETEFGNSTREQKLPKKAETAGMDRRNAWDEEQRI